MSKRSPTFGAGFKVSLPFPASALSPNGRHHYIIKNAAFQTAKDVAVQRIRAVRHAEAFTGPIHLTCHFRCPDRRRRDLDNLYASIKAYIDALTWERVIEDDNDIVTATISKEIDTIHPGVEIEVALCSHSTGTHLA